MTVAAQKTALRRQAVAARDAALEAALDPAAADRASRLLSGFLAAQRGKTVAGYLPIGSEVDPRPAMADLAQFGPVGVPMVTAKAAPLTFLRWTPDAPLVPNAFGTLVPDTDEQITPEVLIVPLVGFDRAGHRLGYGGGFYDRTLQALRVAHPVLAVGFAFAVQELPEIPSEPTDQPLDALVTDAEVLTFR